MSYILSKIRYQGPDPAIWLFLGEDNSKTNSWVWQFLIQIDPETDP